MKNLSRQSPSHLLLILPSCMQPINSTGIHLLLLNDIHISTPHQSSTLHSLKPAHMQELCGAHRIKCITTY